MSPMKKEEIGNRLPYIMGYLSNVWLINIFKDNKIASNSEMNIITQLFYKFLLQRNRTKKYHFVGLNVGEDNGIKYPFALFGYLNQTELNWYESRLKANTDADLTISFGHMPAYEILQGGNRFFDLNRIFQIKKNNRLLNRN